MMGLGKTMKRIGGMAIRGLAVATVLMAATTAEATTLVNGAYPSQFEKFNGFSGGAYTNELTSYLGKGSLTLTNIFNSDAFSDNNRGRFPLPSDLAAAVDGKGPTFTVIYAGEDAAGTAQWIGWYNPINGVTSTGGSAGEDSYDAFIFNLDANRVLRPLYDSTVSENDRVSSMGASSDIYLYSTSPRSLGLYQESYGDSFHKNVYWNPAVPNLDFSDVRIGVIEVYSISVDALTAPAAVPEPATWAMMILGFGMVGGAARYRRRKAAVTYA